MRLFKGIKAFFMPERCPLCGKVNFTGEPCLECEARLSECMIGDGACTKCGNEKKNCDCDRINCLFTGISAPFYNKGIAQEGLYRYKFEYFPNAAEYFGKAAALSFKKRFADVKIDCVCFVPSTKRALKTKYYDYVSLLAKRVAKELKVPLYKDALKKVKDNSKQHGLKLSDRQQNIKGVFKANGDFTGKTVLVADDIKTSGYTLSECSKQLRLAGAKEVYAVSVLITSNSSCKSEENNV